MKNQKNGLTLIDVLFVVFVVLKLTGVITWSWVWVLSPMWILVALIAVFSVIARIAEKFQKNQ